MIVEQLKYFKLAKELNDAHHSLLVEKKLHFRGSINSFSLISLSEEKPELGIKKCSFRNYSTRIKIQNTLKSDIQKIHLKPIPKRLTPEKQLQAWIINYAFNHNGELPFDENIKFISSEIAITNDEGRKIVTDILGYNETANQLCVIELKYARDLIIIKQVNSFENVINEKIDLFKELLSIHGFTRHNEVPPTIQKIVVWPHEKTSPCEKLTKANIIEITYVPSYTFQKF